MTGKELAQLKANLWPSNATRPVRIYAVLDCARHPAVYDLLTRSYREKSCLFAGKLDAELERASPYLLELQPADSVTDQFLLRGWDDAWGILVRTETSFRTLRRHLRTFLRVRTEGGRFLLFRYYDPRVLNSYLPTCTPGELTEIFGDSILELLGFSSSTLESQRYSLVEGALRIESF